jgi:nucleoside 2-deoxyribosyltransferase
VKIYLSGPLFTQAERRWNRQLAQELQDRIAGAQVILPQDFKVGSSYNNPKNFPKIFDACLDALREADVVVAVLDGPDVDSGTALELGVAHERGIPIIGVRTDYRAGQDRGTNLMVGRACARLVFNMSFREDTAALAADIARKLRAELAARGKPKP